MKLSSMKVDAARAEAGDWVGDLPGMEDLRVKVRGLSSTDYTALMSREFAKVPREQRVGGRRDGAVLPAAREAITVRGLAEHILLDWDGLTGDDGTPLPYSKGQAAAFLGDPNFRPFRDAVVYAASLVEEVRADQVEAPLGN